MKPTPSTTVPYIQFLVSYYEVSTRGEMKPVDKYFYCHSNSWVFYTTIGSFYWHNHFGPNREVLRIPIDNIPDLLSTLSKGRT